MRPYAPSDELIVSTLEVINAVVPIKPGTFGRNKKGEITFEHEGGHTLLWDTQKTCLSPDGKRLFICEDGETWPEDQIVLKND